jgi:peptidoglycan/LPS O-acetylase OafA/YrhL
VKSSTGEYYIALDHVRAVAVFMVFTYHFVFGLTIHPLPFGNVPALFPFSLLAEGHTGVALFMTLSGYLFARLLDGRAIEYRLFLWNRALRLLPLLGCVVVIAGFMTVVQGGSAAGYFHTVALGALLPTLPNGGWSITVEMHFYLVLPVLLWLLRRSRWLPVCLVAAALAFRWLVHWRTGGVQDLAFFTIAGRVDQFVLGMLAWHLRGYMTRRHLMAAVCLVAFAVFYWSFDLRGGFYQPSYPSPGRIWIVMPTVEGLAYAVLIAWYDNSFTHSNNAVSRFVGLVGAYSYSIYLLHFFFVFEAAKFVHVRIMDISNFYLACAWSGALFLLMVPIAYLSFRYVESPFLRFRVPYIARDPAPAVP